MIMINTNLWPPRSITIVKALLDGRPKSLEEIETHYLAETGYKLSQSSIRFYVHCVRKLLEPQGYSILNIDHTYRLVALIGGDE